VLDTIPSASMSTAITTKDHLGRLVAGTAAGERPAFRCLYAFLAMPVWRIAAHGLPEAAHASAVTRSTFVEVWHLARYHRNGDRPFDALAWLTAITAGRVSDRMRLPAGAGTGDHDAHTRRELRDLLGPGRALIRTGNRAFVRIDDLDDALTAIADLAAPRRPPRALG